MTLLSLPPIPTEPALLRTPNGTRFADMPVSFLLIVQYAGSPAMILTWLVRAMAEREDGGLGLPPRDENVLAATAGLARDEFDYCTQQLIRDRWLSTWPNGAIRVPWGRIYQASVLKALEYREYVDALRETTDMHERAVAADTYTTLLPLDRS